MAGYCVSRVTIQIANKSYKTPPTVAIRNLELTVKASEFVAILGPSGAGKSTLLNLISRLDEDFSGSITFSPDINLITGKTSLGFVFQEPRLMPWLTAIENVSLVLDNSPESQRRARELLHDVELKGFEDAYPNQLSGGMQRRVAMARAFAIEPAVLLLDEPFASLDAPGAQRLRELLLKLCERLSPTVVLVTHDLNEAIALADRLVFLSERPARVMCEETISLQHPRHPQGTGVRALYTQLLTAHPDLLSGMRAGTTHSFLSDSS